MGGFCTGGRKVQLALELPRKRSGAEVRSAPEGVARSMTRRLVVHWACQALPEAVADVAAASAVSAPWPVPWPDDQPQLVEVSQSMTLSGWLGVQVAWRTIAWWRE